MCALPDIPIDKRASNQASLKPPQLTALRCGQGSGQPAPSTDPMTRWVSEPPRTEPWHGLDKSTYSGQKTLSYSENRPATLSDTGATVG
ncbi:hypothetical protein KVR01_012932 [Diaporthe batatas]|uniref:uncharacterized protein n=1 Tax=Diaporthe batatas TaxID=748121 RepID=UPI001D04FB0F|nr:uncharacterized protein KVR01_012932 [Diaporthe batatas]KAG8157224.1 hypothetical protein KVR01_012932 [Diaporthe batatas]